MPKSNILIFVDWYLPGYRAGGPIRSVANLVRYLKEDYQFYIVTSDTDEGADAPYENILPNNWNDGPQGEKVFYLQQKQSLWRKYKLLREILSSSKFDKVYLNSLFSPLFTLLPLVIMHWHKIDRPIILAPRGMLGAGALAVKSFKKRTFLRLAKWFKLYKNITWHATKEQEEKDIEMVLGSQQDIIKAQNLPASVTENIEKRKKEIPVRFITIARIAPVKNIKYAVDVISNISNKPLAWHLYGPIGASNYWKECRSLIKQLDKEIQVEYRGELPNNKVKETTQNYDFMFLPTTGENFGHAIFEALGAGLPVIISDQTPWRELEKQKAGWDLPLDRPDRFRKVIEKCLEMPDKTYQQWRKGAHQYARQFFKRSDLKKDYHRLFDV